MKKEKQVRSYKRRTKSGKIVTVKAHTAKYEAADEKAKEVSKKPGAGKELAERKGKWTQLEIPFDKEEEKKVLDEVKDEEKKSTSKKSAEKKSTKKVRPVGSGTNGPTPKRKSEEKSTKRTKAETSEPAFTAAEFKEWYRGTGSAADKKVAKALRAQLGRAGYRKLEDEAIDNYSSRGHLSMFKRVSGGSEVSAKSKSSKKSDTPNSMKDLGMRVNKKGEIVWTSDRMKHPEKYKGAWEKETSKSGVKEKAAEKDTSTETGGKRPIDDPIKRARLIEVLRNKGKGNFNRVQMLHDFREYFSRRGGWTPSVKGKELLKEARKEERSL